MMLAVSREASTSYPQAWQRCTREEVATACKASGSSSVVLDRKRYRPTEHFQTEHSWMNDTIGPMYNPRTGLYHLYCQWNPEGTEWGNMSWYSAVSRDLIHWNPHGRQPVLKPDHIYDREGIFTGYVLPRGINGEKNQMTAIYTSVTSPTIHWTLPYERGSEGVSLAISRDEGLTWQKDRTNPVVAAPPEDLQVTGFRDPSLSSLPSLDSLLGRPRDQYLYATLSGGIVEKSPTVFLYSIPVDNLRDWQSLGAIVDIGLDYTPDEKWCGEGGRNFECCSLFELETQTTLITSTEGGKRRWSLWLQGEMSVVDGRPKLEYTKSGVLDWGSFYAASTGQHPVDGRHLIMGWIPEDDVTFEQRRAQGWAGMASLPRELVSLEYSNVTKALSSDLSDIGSIKCGGDAEGTYVIQTVGIRPAKEVLKLREGIQPQELRAHTFTSLSKSIRLPVQRKTWELEFEAHILPQCSAFNIAIQHSSNEYTFITFDPQAERINVDRQYSTILPDVKTSPEAGSHTLYSFKDKDSGEIHQEALRIRLFLDVSVIELYANDRFALSTRIYPAGSGPASVSLIADTSEGMSGSSLDAVTRLSNVALWER